MHQIDNPDRIEGENLVAYLSRFLKEERYSKFRKIVRNRTRHLTLALEDIFQPHNASAVLRSCECFGIQDVHIIENRNIYEVNPEVVMGSSKWLNLKKYNDKVDNTTSCLNSLKEQGYRIVATSPHTGCYSPDDLPIEQKTVLVFGTELGGLTPTALALADDYVKIPMVGFTESLNISVSAAILLNSLTSRLRNSDIPWHLTDIETNTLLIEWLKLSINKSDVIVRNYYKRENP